MVLILVKILLKFMEFILSPMPCFTGDIMSIVGTHRREQGACHAPIQLAR